MSRYEYMAMCDFDVSQPLEVANHSVASHEIVYVSFAPTSRLPRCPVLRVPCSDCKYVRPLLIIFRVLCCFLSWIPYLFCSKTRTLGTFFFVFIPFSIHALLSPFLPVVTQIRGVPSSPLPPTMRAFIFIARRIQHFLRSWTRVELWTHCDV